MSIPSRDWLVNRIRQIDARIGDRAAEANYQRAYGRTMQQTLASHRQQLAAIDAAASAARGGGAAVTQLGNNGGGAHGSNGAAQVALPAVLVKVWLPWLLGGLGGWWVGRQDEIPSPPPGYAPAEPGLPQQQAPPLQVLPPADPGGILVGIGGIFSAVAGFLGAIPKAAAAIGGVVAQILPTAIQFAPVVAAVAILYAVSAVFRLRLKVG